MKFIEYIDKFNQIIGKNRSNPDTIENYLAAFADLPPILERTDKSDFFAEEFRTCGNNVFASGNYQGAALLYTGSLMHAPPYSKCTALAYANRSAAFYHLKAYEDCLLDIDRALDSPYPDHLKQKILLRKNTALRRISDGLGPSKKKNEELKCARGENNKLTGVSLGIEMVHNVQEGRSLVARVSFQPREVLLIDKPYLTVPKLDYDPVFCHHCLKATLCLIPCDRCIYRVYCSEKCRADSFNKYHRTECVIIKTVSAIKPMNRQAIISLIRCIVIFTEQGADFQTFYKDFEDIENAEDPAELGFTEGRYIPDSRKAFLSLPVKELKQGKQAILFESAYVVALLRNYTDLFKTNTDIHRVAKLLVKVNIIYTMNHFPIRYSSLKEPKAYAMFPLTGLANHACANNTVAYVDNNNKLVLRASQYIKPGDQIQYNYHNLFFVFDGQMKKPGRSQQCKRRCGKCEKTYSYPLERQPQMKMDKKLILKLTKNPYDIESLWKLLNSIQGKNQRYTCQVQMLKVGIVNAYEECNDELKGLLRFSLMGIL